MFTNVLQLSFWFDVRASVFTSLLFWIFTIFFILVLAFAIYSTYFLKKKAKGGTTQVIWTKLSYLTYSTGIVGFILMFLKQQRAAYLGMRVWLMLWLLICFIWLLFIIKYIVKEVPRIKEERLARKEVDKYLP